MPSFSYRGRDARGVEVRGLMEADSATLVADQLAITGVLPLDIVPATGRAAQLASGSEGAAEGSLSAWWASMREPQVDTNDLMLFARQMGTLQKAGVPILQALQGLQDSADKPAFARLLREIRQSLDAGRDLATTLSRHPRQFSEFFVSMVQVGELTGGLSQAFFRLFGYMQFEKDTRDRVKAALRYPSFVVVAMGIALMIVNIFVIPVFAKVFASFNAELPLLTRLLIGLSDFFVNWWWLMAVVAVAAVLAVRRFLATPAGRMWWGEHKLKIPLAGPIILKTTLSRFSSSLAMALRAGVPISQSLAVVSRTLDNDFIAGRIDGMRQAVERGESLVSAVRSSQVFPPMVLQMIAVGEETGSIDEMLDEVSALYERESEFDIKGLSAAIEPILLGLVALLVLVLALGIFLPLWNLGSVAMRK